MIKVDIFQTITLWALFLLFTLSASVLFLLLVYLDLVNIIHQGSEGVLKIVFTLQVSNNKNSRELAICCGAFG